MSFAWVQTRQSLGWRLHRTYILPPGLSLGVVGSKLYLLQAWVGMGWEDSYVKSQVARLFRFNTAIFG